MQVGNGKKVCVLASQAEKTLAKLERRRIKAFDLRYGAPVAPHSTSYTQPGPAGRYTPLDYHTTPNPNRANAETLNEQA